jgi:PAS domain-containing protein
MENVPGNEVLQPVISIDLNQFQPVDCTPAFSELLGYDSPQACVVAFSSQGHIDGYNLLQLYEMKEFGALAHSITLLDVDKNPAVYIKSISVDKKAALMHIEGTARLTAEHEHNDFSFTLDPDTNQLDIQPIWAARLGLSQIVEAGGAQAWLQRVLEEDRPLVQAWLDSPNRQTIRYRLVESDGTIVSVAQQSWVIGQGTRYACNLTVIDDPIAINDILLQVRNFLAQETANPTLEINEGIAMGNCAICGHRLNEILSNVLCFPGYGLTRGELLHIVTHSTSLSSIGKASGWYDLLRNVHAEGFHILASLNENDALTLEIVNDTESI